MASSERYDMLTLEQFEVWAKRIRVLGVLGEGLMALHGVSHAWRHCHVGECGRPGRIRGVTTATPSYKGHRYPVEIINHCVWLYFRFPLSFREVEERMLVRGVAVSYETIVKRQAPA